MADEIHTTRVVYHSRSDEFTLHVIGDTHIGNSAVREDRLKDLVGRIANSDKSLVVLLGDTVDCITVHDRKRFEAHDLAPWIKTKDLDNLSVVEADHFCDLLQPIKSKIIAYHGGNHELTIARDNNYSVCGYIATKLGILYVGDSGAALRIRFTREGGGTTSYNGYLIHGWGGARTDSTKEAKVASLLLDNPDVDFACIGHDHSRLFKEAYQAYYGRNRLHWRHRIAVMCGAFITNPRYGRRVGYAPTYPGAVQIVFKPDSGEIGARFE